MSKDDGHVICLKKVTYYTSQLHTHKHSPWQAVRHQIVNVNNIHFEYSYYDNGDIYLYSLYWLHEHEALNENEDRDLLMDLTIVFDAIFGSSPEFILICYLTID